MATPTEKASQTPYVPVTTNTNFYRGISPIQRDMTGTDATQDKRQAYDLVESEFGPQRVAAQRRLSQLGEDRQYETDVQNNFGEKHDKSLERIGGQLQDTLGGITDRTQQLHSGASQVIGDAYGRAQNATQGASDNVLSALAEQMGRLGLEEAGRDPNAEISQMDTDMSGRHAISGAGAVGNAEDLGASMTSIAAMRQGDSAQEFAGKRTELANQVMANINTINRDYNQKRDEVFSEINALEQARGQALNATLKQVIEDRLERERQGRLDELSEEMARRGMAVQEGYLDLSGQRFGLEQELGRGNLGVAQGHLGVAEGQLALSREQMEEQKAQLEAQLEAADSPWARAQAQLELDKLEAEIRQIDAEIANPGGSSNNQNFDGLNGARQWLDTQVGFTPEAKAAYMDDFDGFVTQANDQAANTGAPFNETLKSILDAATAENQVDRNVFNNLYHVYVGKF